LQDDMFVVSSLANIIKGDAEQILSGSQGSQDRNFGNGVLKTIPESDGYRVRGWACYCLANDPSKSSQIGVGMRLESRLKMHRIPFQVMRRIPFQVMRPRGEGGPQTKVLQPAT